MSSSEFFKYGRSYALYMQGMTDVGRQAQKNADGTESDASQEELRRAAIERDALLLGKAVGSGMSLNEFRDMYDRVELLSNHYRDQKITQKVYQEKLWSIPDIVRRERVAGQKAPPHYAPTRDKHGNPVESKQMAAEHVPVEQMQRLSPEMANLPKPNMKEFWSNMVAGANPDESTGTSAVPPGHGSVPVRSGAPPMHSSPQQQPGSVGVPSSGKAPGGFMDSIQASLDAIGVVEPTPFADGTNAAISGFRALTDPENAGKHLKNAAISLVSAAFPYVGDSAKLLKYGKGSGFGSLGKNGGGLGSVVNAVFGGAAGGGRGGSRPPRTPTGVGGGGSGGGQENPAGGAADAMDSLAARITDFGQVLGPVGFVVLGATAGIKLFVSWLSKIDATARQAIDTNRELAELNGGVGLAYMQLDAERTLRSIKHAREIAGPLSRLTAAQSRSEEAQQEALMPYKKLKMDMDALFAQGLAITIEQLSKLDAIAGGINMLYEASGDMMADEKVRAAKLDGELEILRMQRQMDQNRPRDRPRNVP